MKKSLSHAFIQPPYFKRSLGMTLFSKKEKEEEASVADIPAAPKSTFQSTPKSPKMPRKKGLRILQPFLGKILTSPETFPAKVI